MDMISLRRFRLPEVTTAAVGRSESTSFEGYRSVRPTQKGMSDEGMIQ